ncbi:MAG: heavy metal translocating P-type ATPase [Acidobacteriota bacterium]
MEFRITGMDCADEVAALKREVAPLVGGEANLSFNLLHGTMTLRAGAPPVPQRAILDAVKRAGLTAEAVPADEQPVPVGKGRVHRLRLALTVSSGLLTAAGFFVHLWIGGPAQALGGETGGANTATPIVVAALYLLGIFAGISLILPKTLRALRRARPDMNLLMTVAVVGAVVLGAWLEAASVSFLFALSLLLESWSVSRARRAVEALLDLSPRTARVLGEGDTQAVISCEAVPIGAKFLVLPGERIPLDGLVERGESEVNQAPITGESKPVPKPQGAEVFAGTINGEGALEVRSTKRHNDTTLSRIIHMVQEAQARRAPTEQWVERFAARYTPAVMSLAMATAVIPPLLGASWPAWIYRALVLLVIACPCALVISTPVTIVAGLATAARHGILIKGGLFLEAPASLRAMAFDKTGTLTKGEPEVVEVVSFPPHNQSELLERAAAIEARSTHPLAKAILAYAQKEAIPAVSAEDVQMIPGKGAAGTIRGKLYWLGSHRHLEQRGQETPDVHERLEAMMASGRSVVVVGNDTHVCGLIGLADTLRPGAGEALAALRRAGIRRIIMLTGDNEGTARGIAHEAGIDGVLAELLPEDKVKAMDALVAQHGRVAMVGDGVNDAPAMARAGLGISMGAAGSDAAIEASDIALMTDDLGKLPWLVEHSRRALRIIRQNIVFSIAVKVIVFLLALAGFATLWMAIAADMGASLLVIANALRLLQPPRPERHGASVGIASPSPHEH